MRLRPSVRLLAPFTLRTWVTRDTPHTAMHLTDLLQEARARHASDLHLRAGQTPWVRVHGVLMPLSAYADAPALTQAQLMALLDTVLPTGAREWREQQREIDFACELPLLGRYRVNAFAHRQGLGAVLRCIADSAPDLSALHAPAVLPQLLHGPGLLLVTGATGSGKSTTLAAMVQHLNRHTRQHILTLEDPIEFVHASAQCLVTQREIGQHSVGFAPALRAALREDPDVLLIGELRDLDTIRLALTAAETGHLVLASLHTRHAAGSVERIVDVFDAAEKSLVRAQLADALLGVHPTPTGNGRAAVFELLVATPAVRHLIREGKTSQLASAMQTGAAHGMVTMAQALERALADGRIASPENHGARL